MNRQAFIDRLRLGLSGLPAAALNEAVADYEAHFAEGAAAGRTVPATMASMSAICASSRQAAISSTQSAPMARDS